MSRVAISGRRSGQVGTFRGLREESVSDIRGLPAKR